MNRTDDERPAKRSDDEPRKPSRGPEVSPRDAPVDEKVVKAMAEGRQPPKPPGAVSGRWDRSSYGGIVWNEGADPLPED